MGARFVVTDAVMQPIIREAAKRGLGYLDDGTAPRSVAAALAAGQAMPFAKGDVSHRRGADSGGNRPGAGQARKHGQGARNRRRRRLGLADLDRADRLWIKALESHGIMLVPLTTAMLKSKSG